MTSPAPLLGPASRLSDFFTTDEALAAGLRPRDLAAGDDFRQVFWGGYVKTSASPTYADEVAFALRVVPSAAFATEHSASRLLGGIAPGASNLHLGTTVRHKCKRDGIKLRFYTHPPRLVLVKGVWATAPPQTFLDLARSLEFADLLVLGDSLVRRSDCTPSDIQRFVADSSAHGASHARAVAKLVRSRVDSPNESRLRLLMVSGGLPEPTLNLVVHGTTRRASRKIDLAFEEYKVGVEFDGRHHIEQINQWNEDILRREELEAMGWRFIIITSSTLYAAPLDVLKRIADALVLAGATDIHLQQEWRRHFG
ncbi:hypothetical protein GCM10011492_26100 [Flexivirga endophytica]|uniref:Restriction endonuclease type II-like domain-containing protein n=1 Tax=Flexivirga endophytica TaxID=1849103 RepID=A0A916T6X9_9MICO|nr:hypothetical protein [Flexivirga endophytica]GGB34244.1 hypothetical protein GCM10011492_26100 [Flexivirga endophytica]GHB42214.1 hypothetical protein GCM10008112_08490 [Flexivirga endophytica]